MGMCARPVYQKDLEYQGENVNMMGSDEPLKVSESQS